MIEEQIWEIIDGSAKAETLASHQEMMASNRAYRIQFEQLSQLHGQLSNLPLESPSVRFEENVMDSVGRSLGVGLWSLERSADLVDISKDQRPTTKDRPTTNNQTLDRVPYYYLGLLSILSMIGWWATSGTKIRNPLVEDTLVEGMGFVENLVAVLSSRMFVYSVFVLCIGFVLFLLDKNFLKPYFETRKLA
jgi:hypothetical protein